MKLLSLFSGIGAFEKALDRLKIDYELVGFSEIDKYAVKSYCAIHNVEEAMNLGDITKTDEKLLPKNIDLITYGFPCQDISIAGKQKGLFNEDGTQTRSGLFFEALRIIEETQPKVAIAENVKNLTSKKFSEQFKIVLDSLESAGYNNYWQVLNSKDYGIPQNRERLFIISIRKDVDNGTFKFPEGFPLELRLKDMLENEVDEKYFLSNPQQAVAVAMRGRYAEDGTVKQNIEVSNREYANALTTVQKDSMVADSSLKIRKLTPKECFRLMDFDDEDFERAEAVNSNTQLYKQAVNSIVVAVPYYIIEALFKANIFIKKENKQMEFKINEVQIPEKPTFNYEELKQELQEKANMYASLVYGDDEIKQAKADKANLNKLKKALNDERIRQEKEYMKPFNEFKAQVNEIIGIIDKPISVIDEQVKLFEEKQKDEKLEKIKEFWEGTEHPDWLTCKQIFDAKWLNTSTSMKKVQEAIEERLAQIDADVKTIGSLPEFSFEALETYKLTIDLNRAIAEGQRLADIQQRKQEAEAARLKAEAEKTVVETKTPPETEPVKAEVSPAKQWVKFAAFLSTDDAAALKAFCDSRSIEIKAI